MVSASFLFTVIGFFEPLAQPVVFGIQQNGPGLLRGRLLFDPMEKAAVRAGMAGGAGLLHHHQKGVVITVGVKGQMPLSQFCIIQRFL